MPLVVPTHRPLLPPLAPLPSKPEVLPILPVVPVLAMLADLSLLPTQLRVSVEAVRPPRYVFFPKLRRRRMHPSL